MVSGKFSALSGAIAREQSIANISANLANVNTAGYKKTRMSFESMLRGEKQQFEAKGINYSRVSGSYKDFSQGPLKVTDNDFDFAIEGNGFFKIRTDTGDLLTRNGNFHLSDIGALVTDSGHAVLDAGNAEISIQGAENTRIVVDQEGRIFTVEPNGDTAEIAQLAIVDVADQSSLIAANDTSFSLPQGLLDAPAQDFRVSQGSLEMSNVNMTDEMAKMINDNRLFETYHDILKKYSEVGEKVNELGTLG